ncbi:MAG: PspC domain-containing protein [Chloroflexi bacterium]|nr:PspC domain-containing protein [Chloroflexota bacterium]
MERRLYRSRTNRILWGVCGGLADYFGIDPTIVRLIAVLLVFAGGIGIIAYLVLAIIMPLEGTTATSPKETVRENVEEIGKATTELGREIRSTFEPKEGEAEEAARRKRTGAIIGIILIAIGVIFFLANFNPFWWFRWGYIWPVILIIIGLLVIFGIRRR